MGGKARPAGAISPLLAQLETWLAANRPALSKGLRPGVSPSQLRAFTPALPSELRDWWSWRDGMSKGECAPLIGNYAPLSLAGCKRSIALMNRLAALGDVPHPDWWNAGWIPFLETIAGDSLCVDTTGCFGGDPGQVLQFFHDGPERDVIAASFGDWLRTTVSALEAGLWRSDRGDLVPTSEAQLAEHQRRLNPGYPRMVRAR